MTSEQRKEGIREKTKLSGYPRRNAAVFNDENDHNPIVLADCPRCHGRGKVSSHTREKDRIIHRLHGCPECQVSGTNGELEPYFTNNAAAVEVRPNEKGWLTGPCCGWRFKIKIQMYGQVSGTNVVARSFM